MRRMGIKQSHPEVALDLLDLAQKRNKRRTTFGIDGLTRARFFSPQIHSVISRVLANEIKLAHSFADEPADFRQHGLHCPAAMFTAHLRNHAKAARVIAALGNLYI